MQSKETLSQTIMKYEMKYLPEIFVAKMHILYDVSL